MTPRRFAVFILSHGRPDRVLSYETLRRAGYTGPIHIIIDDEDTRAAEYRERFGEQVIQFCKRDVAARIDAGDNTDERRSILYARRASFEIARSLGLTHFSQWDDDYKSICYKFTQELVFLSANWSVKSLDQVFDRCLDFLDRTHVATLAFGQSGDLMGGENSYLLAKSIKAKRKAMNTFLFKTDRPVDFQGKLNEDVNTYCELGRRGLLFLTNFAICIFQLPTQANPGGATEMYLRFGTYVKSMMTVMYAPSCTKLSLMGYTNQRIHHQVMSKYAYPKIVPESYRKPLPKSP